MAVVTPAERTAAASVTAVPRSLASSISPAFSDMLLTLPFAGLHLELCGSLKIVYDLTLLYSFRHIKPPEEKPEALVRTNDPMGRRLASAHHDPGRDDSIGSINIPVNIASL
jgi:hypothetical protein